MKVKIDTREKFTAVMPVESHLYDNMAAELAAACKQYLQNQVKNVVLNLENLNEIDNAVASTFVELQREFNEKNASLVICGMKPAVESVFKDLELPGFLNT